MNPSSVDIKDLLEAESGLDLTFAENLFIGMEPPEPDNSVTIFDTPGFPPQLTLDSGQADVPGYFYPSIQIRVRNRNYLDGYHLARNLAVLLHGRGPETWNGTVYTSMVCTGEPALLDWDTNGRSRFVINFNLQRSA
jgi:hypothetical protein